MTTAAVLLLTGGGSAARRRRRRAARLVARSLPLTLPRDRVIVVVALVVFIPGVVVYAPYESPDMKRAGEQVAAAHTKAQWNPFVLCAPCR